MCGKVEPEEIERGVKGEEGTRPLGFRQESHCGLAGVHCGSDTRPVRLV